MSLTGFRRFIKMNDRLPEGDGGKRKQTQPLCPPKGGGGWVQLQHKLEGVRTTRTQTRMKLKLNP